MINSELDKLTTDELYHRGLEAIRIMKSEISEKKQEDNKTRGHDNERE